MSPDDKSCIQFVTTSWRKAAYLQGHFQVAGYALAGTAALLTLSITLLLASALLKPPSVPAAADRVLRDDAPPDEIATARPQVFEEEPE